MACTGTNWKKRKDIIYITFMANMFSKNTGKEIGIYERKMDGIGKFYDFEEVEKGKKYAKVVRFNKHTISKNILSDNKRKGLDASSNIRESNTTTLRESLDGDSGRILQKEQSKPISNRPKKSKTNNKYKKRD